MPPQSTSWPDWPYPKWRDKTILSAHSWLQGRRSDDGAEGLWRVHDELYDLTDFISTHPGGSDWLVLTKGIDITEAFEVHHLGPQAESLLSKFHVRSAKLRRNSPFTFHKAGFYRTLKARVYQTIKDKGRPALKSAFVLDTLACLTIALSTYAAVKESYCVAVIAGLLLCLTTNCSHNFIHQRNHWRMYYFNMSLMSVREWRVVHALSHHLYANTVLDLEMALFEPWLQWLPKPDKSWLVRYFSTLYSPFLYPFIFHAQAANSIFTNSCQVQDLIGLVLPVLMTACGTFAGTPVVLALVLWTLVILSGSFFFGFIGVNVAHHHPDIFHDGDAPRSDRDWGLNQIDAVGDRTEFNGLFFTLVTYGHHTLHHLFPTVDHSYLDEVYPIVQQTCDEFGCNLTVTTTWELLCGQYRQLMRNKPNDKPRA